MSVQLLILGSILPPNGHQDPVSALGDPSNFPEKYGVALKVISKSQEKREGFDLKNDDLENQ